MSEPIYDTYGGRRWRYGLRYRPAEYCSLPAGWIVGSQSAHPKFRRYGTIDFARKLSDQEVFEWELVPVEVET